MSKYHFQTDKVGFSDEGLHLLRNRFNFKTISYKKIHSIEIMQGWEMNNWLVLLLFGLLLVIFAFSAALSLYLNYIDPNVHIIYTEQILMILLPLMMGLFTIYSALQRGEVLWVSYGTQKLKFPLKALHKSGKRQEFLQFLRTHVELKNKISLKSH
ncbi:hypothetical protein [Cesiribacter sp. SM1]|uniref:hypothetical protein n=1 Tax=Cesiribacter sp. SM1 TaxID=2861196 RepID=UPI001CD794B8|nr:hypothetical protein [Cesiribacter sp. SM1]